MASFKNTGLTVDGIFYDVLVRYPDIARSFAQIGTSYAAIAGNVEKQIIGTKITYSLTVDPKPSLQATYNSFYEMITNPANPTHIFVMPFGASTISFTGTVLSGSDSFGGFVGGIPRWYGLNISIMPIYIER